MEFYNKDVKDIEQILDTSYSHGMTIDKVDKLLDKQGLNTIDNNKNHSNIFIIIKALSGPLNIILIIAACLAFLTSIFVSKNVDFLDPLIIITTVFINTALVSFQEIKAIKSLKSLNNLIVPKVTVIRNKKINKINSAKLVVGDVIYLQAGDVVPADVRIIECAQLTINESILTGESSPVYKNHKIIFEKKPSIINQSNLCFASTSVISGTSKAVVIKTGFRTEIGQIAKLLNNQKINRTPLQSQINKLSFWLALFAILVCVSVFILLFLTSGIHNKDYDSFILIAVTLAVSIIPESLPIVISIILSSASYNMSKHNVIVKDLQSIETLGAISVICTDKTGTLTQNKMKLMNYFNFKTTFNMNETNGLDSSWFFHHVNCLALCNNSTIQNNITIGNPTELALLEWCRKHNFNEDIIRKQYPRQFELAFDSERKIMSSINLVNNKKVMYSKGAIDNLIYKCSSYLDKEDIKPLSDLIRNNIINNADKIAQKGLRVLGCAFRNVQRNDEEENDMVFISGVSLMDPLQKYASTTVTKALNAGISVVMITGDHLSTATNIAKKVGIISSQKDIFLDTSEIQDWTKEDIASQINNVKVFARATPKDKLNIINDLQDRKNIVAMTGDGVNDAPSLKAANIGIAMGIQGTEVSKDAANIILSDDKLSTIINGIEEGRNVYEKIKKVIAFIFACNLAQLLTIFGIILITHHSPLQAIQVLWFNLVIESIIAIPISMEKNNEFLIKLKPRKYGENIFKGLIRSLLSLSIVVIISVSLAFYFGYTVFSNHNLQLGQTFAFFTMINSPILCSLIFETRNYPNQSKNLWKYKLNKRLFLFAFLIFTLNIFYKIHSIFK